MKLVVLAEKFSLPVVTSLNGKAAIAENHPLSAGVCGTYSRWCANRAVAQADLVFFIGSHTGSQVTHNWRIPKPGTPVIQLDIDPEEIGRSYPVLVGLVGDAQATLGRMNELIKEPVARSNWIEAVQRLKSEWREEVKAAWNSDQTPIRPERICREISDFLPADAVLVGDTGQAAYWTGTMVELKHATQSYIRCAGSLGWAFPASLGVKCALPDRPVLCFTGDGGFYYHISELETAARFGINTVVLVNNNHSLGQEQRLFNAAYGGTQRGRAHSMWMFKETNFAKVAEGMGCLGIRVEKASDLRAALRTSLRRQSPRRYRCRQRLQSASSARLGGVDFESPIFRMHRSCLTCPDCVVESEAASEARSFRSEDNGPVPLIIMKAMKSAASVDRLTAGGGNRKWNTSHWMFIRITPGHE